MWGPDYNHCMFRVGVLAGLSSLLILGCTSAAAPALSTATPGFATSTLPPSPASSATSAPPSPTAVPTATPRAGMTSAPLYVRSEPASASSQLGLIGPASMVQIIGKDPSGNWYQILYPQGKDGTGWVFAQYIQVENKEAIPIVGGPSGPGPSAVVIQQVNVRKGPGTAFDSLGTLNPEDAVTLTGKDNSSAWLQIAYSAGPDGKGWVAAGYVEASGLDGLPIVGEGGQLVGTGTPTVITASPTPTRLPAADDGDSANLPAVNVEFGPGEAGAILYSSDLSAPDGDATDWIGFTPYQPGVTISLSCEGTGGLTSELLLRGERVQGWTGPSCGRSTIASLSPNVGYVLKLAPIAEAGQLVSVHYTLSIVGWP